MRPHNRFRWAWWLLAYASLGLGLVGIFLPVLPTVPLVLLAAFAAARGSPRLRARLLSNPRFGPTIRDWERNRAVSRQAKRLALGAMAVCACALVLLLLVWPGYRWWAAALPIACMGLVGAWLWRRPEPPAPDGD